MDGIIKNQEEMMNRIVKLERSQTQVPLVPYKGKFQKGGQFYNPKNEHEVPNTLAPANIVDENPWCLECSEAHWEHSVLTILAINKSTPWIVSWSFLK